MNTIRERSQLSCKLTSPDLQERKRTVITRLKNLALDQIETETGFKYKFEGSDRVLDVLNDFIKTERLCCDFFVFTLNVSGEYTWLELSGPEGTKDFIKQEIGM
jgi:hypothetical protein